MGAWFALVALILTGGATAQTFVINEFQASNHSTTTDEDGDYEDWIELHNQTAATQNLAGFTITDNPASPTKWTFPAISVPANGYVRIWASNKDRTSPPHTNFRLAVEGGYIGLYNPSRNLEDSINYGPQARDYSYGRKPDGTNSWYFFATPTPGLSNATEGRIAIVEDPVFTPPAGVYTGSLSVDIATATAGSTIYYTLGGYDPSQSSTPYAGGGIGVTTTTVIRARAYRSGYWPSDTVTQTYFVNVNTSTPLLSVVCDPDRLAEIYYANLNGIVGERPCSVEYWEKAGVFGFEATCGLRIHGGASKSRTNIHKKSFRLHFRRDVGPRKLNYPIFPDTTVDRFNKLVLRANYNDGWTHWSATQRENAIEVRDQLSRNLRLEMGDLALHGTECALWLNGHHWGVYNITERMEGDFLQSYLDYNDWDIISLQTELKEGDMTAWNSFYNWFSTTDFSVPANYQQLQTMLDLKNFTNYMISNYWQRNSDWPHHNGYAYRARGLPGAKWRFIDWDIEDGFGGGPLADNVSYDMWNHRTGSRLQILLSRMTANPDYRVYFAQRMDILLNTVYDEPHINQRMYEEAEKIRPIIPQEAQWRKFYGEWSDVTRWEAALGRAADFNNQRTQYVRAHVRDRFAEVTGWRDVVVQPPQGGEGDVILDGEIRPPGYPWVGQFFEGVPLLLHAEPKPGYEFIAWSDGSLPATDTVSVILGSGSGGTLVAAGSVWRYHDLGVDLGTAWRAPAYNDSGWSAGPAELGYGDGDEQTVIGPNPWPDPGNKYPTYYFRRTFNVPDPSQYGGLTMRVKRDDGVVVFLNGSFIYKSSNMTSPAASIDYEDWADGTGDTWDTDIAVNPALLVAGDNVLAAEIHQRSPTSSDISFDLELAGASGAATYTIYAIFGVDPNPPYFDLVDFVARNKIIVEFNRPVEAAGAETVGNYTIDHGVGNPMSATMLSTTTVLLEFSNNLSPATVYQVSAINIQPVVGNPIPPGSPATGTASYVIPPVTINEIMYNTHGTDVEWVELHNTTGSPQDVSGWYITDDESYPAVGEGNWSLPSGTVIPPNGYLVVGLDSDMTEWYFPPGVPFVQALINSGGNLNNGGDNVAMFDGAVGGSLIDGSLLTHYPDLAQAGRSLEKSDEDFPWRPYAAAWHAATTPIGWYTPLAEFATPGRGNSTPGGSASSVDDWQLY